MEGTKILTSQNVVLSLNTNIVLWRILAYFLDILVIAGYIYLIVSFLDSLTISGSDDDTIEIIVLIAFYPVALYSLITEFLLNGRTFGKYICGIRVVKINGLKCGFTEYLLRWLFRIVDIYPMFFLGFLFEETGYVMGVFLIGVPAFLNIITSKDHQRWGDKVAGTTVVKTFKKVQLSKTIFKEIREDYIPTFPQVIKLSDNDMRIIKDTLLLSKKSKNYNTIKRLREKVQEVMGVDSNLDDEEFLLKVMDDFNHYTKSL